MVTLIGACVLCCSEVTDSGYYNLGLSKLLNSDSYSLLSTIPAYGTPVIFTPLPILGQPPGFFTVLSSGNL